MVGDVAPRAEGRVPLAEAARRDAGLIDGLRDEGSPAGADVLQDDGQEVVDRPLFDDKVAIHESLAELELGIEENGELGRGRLDSYPDRFAGAVAEAVQAALGIDELERALFQHAVDVVGEQPVHGGGSVA